MRQNFIIAVWTIILMLTESLINHCFLDLAAPGHAFFFFFFYNGTLQRAFLSSYHQRWPRPICSRLSLNPEESPLHNQHVSIISTHHSVTFMMFLRRRSQDQIPGACLQLTFALDKKFIFSYLVMKEDKTVSRKKFVKLNIYNVFSKEFAHPPSHTWIWVLYHS